MVLPDLRQIDEHADQDVHTPGGLRLDQDQVSAVYVHAQIVADAVGDLPDDGEIGDVCLCGLRILRVEDMEKLQPISGVKEQVAEHAVLDRILWCLVIHYIYRCGALGIVLFRCVL